jgi:hypothetical protein
MPILSYRAFFHEANIISNPYWQHASIREGTGDTGENRPGFRAPYDLSPTPCIPTGGDRRFVPNVVLLIQYISVAIKCGYESIF